MRCRASPFGLGARILVNAIPELGVSRTGLLVPKAQEFVARLAYRPQPVGYGSLTSFFRQETLQPRFAKNALRTLFGVGNEMFVDFEEALDVRVKFTKAPLADVSRIHRRAVVSVPTE